MNANGQEHSVLCLCKSFKPARHGFLFQPIFPSAIHNILSLFSRKKYNINLYGADEYGTLSGVTEMMAEIYARGPIACLLNSEPPQFNDYKGGIIECPENAPLCNLRQYNDHVIVIAGWGVDAAGKEYWVGRNSYGTKVCI